jgi:2-polyprenyl-6-hydroxyphenyl methylase / 3-demethylubiquinone-9 3-methyltransferase
MAFLLSRPACLCFRAVCRRYCSSFAHSSSVDPFEVEKFGKLAEKWWDPAGPQAMLHLMNPARIGYIRHQMGVQYGCVAEPEVPSEPFRGLSFLDIGCGGGFASESLSRMGGNVLGVDAAEESIGIARQHAEENGLIGENSPYSLNYIAGTAEMLAEDSQQFDVVTALDIIEHVNDPTHFLCTCLSLVRPGGSLFVSTISRTPLSYALTIAAAEYALRLVPVGTHDWNKFITVDELRDMVDHFEDYRVLNNLDDEDETISEVQFVDATGMIYDPLRNRWGLDASNLDVNYIAHIIK